MICEILDASNFFVLWGLLTVVGAVSVLSMSGIAFMKLYVNPSYELWRWKTNPRFPPPELIKSEITVSLKGIPFVTFMPTLTLWMSKYGYSHAYCGFEEDSWADIAKQFMILWLTADFYEFFYHWCGHKFNALWARHQAHHLYHNPTPFAVIADEWFDQLFRGLPLGVFPLLGRVNMDMMFGQWVVFFYLYGLYIHTGYETPFLSPHQPFINTSYHHHLHHAISTNNKPLHTGFFFKLWDQLFGSVHTKKCFCVRCQHAEGKRTEKEFKQIQIPDYSCLAEPSFWFSQKQA